MQISRRKTQGKGNKRHITGWLPLLGDVESLRLIDGPRAHVPPTEGSSPLSLFVGIGMT
jgi:hypothetical protein